MLPVLKNRFVPSLWDEFFGKNNVNRFFDSEFADTMPAVNIREDGDSFNIEVAAPGIDKKDFNIKIENNVLSISTEQKAEKEEKKDTYIRKEFNYFGFQRSFALPESVDHEKIKANHKDGVLMVSIPKKEEAKEKPPKTIKIS
jgi:HSP20 family protein